MHYTDLKTLDLNLLVTFNALMEERSVTRAARRMFLSQPAMSRAFHRLQAMFKDELLVRAAKGYEPTHRASLIYAKLQDVLPTVTALFSEPDFDPAKVTDIFKIESTDWSAPVIVPRLVAILAERAPGIRINIVPRAGKFERLETNAVDLVFSPSIELNSESDAEAQHLRFQILVREELTCLVRAGHPLAKSRITMRRYLKAQHLSLSPMQGVPHAPLPFLAERQLVVAALRDRLGQKLDVRVRTPYFASVGPIVETTDLIATVPLQVARHIRTPRLRIVPAPIEFHNFTINQVWHSRNDSTPMHKWVRGVIRTLAEGLT